MGKWETYHHVYPLLCIHPRGVKSTSDRWGWKGPPCARARVEGKVFSRISWDNHQRSINKQKEERNTRKIKKVGERIKRSQKIKHKKEIERKEKKEEKIGEIHEMKVTPSGHESRPPQVVTDGADRG